MADLLFLHFIFFAIGCSRTDWYYNDLWRSMEDLWKYVDDCSYVLLGKARLKSRYLFAISANWKTGAFDLAVAEAINVWRANTEKYSNKVRKLLRGGIQSQPLLFSGIFHTTLERNLEEAHFSTRLKPSDVYRFSQWRFIPASKVFCDEHGTLCPLVFVQLFVLDDA